MPKNQQGFAHLFLLILLSGLFTFSILPITRHYNDGKSAVAGVFLAKGGDDGGSSGGGSSSGSGDSGSHNSGGSSGSQDTGKSNTLAPAAVTPPKLQKAETKVETKKVKEAPRVETKTTPDRIKSDIRQGNLRVKFEIKNGEVEIETKVKEGEDETELENEAENEAEKEVEAELEKADLKIATAPGQLALVNKRVGALTNFPLSVDPTTRQLTVTTPQGSKVVTVLPQKAIDNMLASHIINDIVSEKVNNSLASIPNLVKLETKNGVLGYKVKGTKTHKLLGLIPIKTGVEVFVSAENGQVVESTQSFLGRILTKIAP